MGLQSTILWIMKSCIVMKIWTTMGQTGSFQYPITISDAIARIESRQYLLPGKGTGGIVGILAYFIAKTEK